MKLQKYIPIFPVFLIVAVLFTTILPRSVVAQPVIQTAAPLTGVVVRNANLRAGPGTTFAITGSAQTGQTVTIAGQNQAGDWYQLDTGLWIAAFLVETKSIASPSPSLVVQSIFFNGAVAEVESDEYVVVANTGTATVNLQGWQVSAGTPEQTLTLPSIELPAGQTCRVYTNEIHEDGCKLSFGSTSALWNNKGDCGYLYDPNGTHVSTYCYGDIADGGTYTSGSVSVASTPAANRSANLRGGPGTSYPVVGGVQAGQVLTIVAQNPAGDWYQLSDGNWIAAFLVDNAPDTLSTIADTPMPTSVPPVIEPTAQPAPQPVAQPTADPRTGQRRGAICRDDTTSGATGRGACSHHGGVAQWLYY